MQEQKSRSAQRIAIIVAISTGMFVLIAALVAFGQTGSFDRIVLLALRNPDDMSDALGPLWFEKAATEFSAFGGYTVLTTLSVIGFAGLWFQRQHATAWFLAAALLSGAVVSTLLKLVFSRPRPELVDHLDKVFTFSFPSGHAMFGMMAWLTFAAVITRCVPDHAFRVFVVTIAVVMGLLIGVSRVYLGVHWPTDVLAGWALGVAWAGTCWLIADRFSQARHPKAIRR